MGEAGFKCVSLLWESLDCRCALLPLACECGVTCEASKSEGSTSEVLNCGGSSQMYVSPKPARAAH